LFCSAGICFNAFKAESFVCKREVTAVAATL
jgi:hypothetical protein